MCRCEDEKMWRWEDDICVDVKMRGYVKMRRREDEKMKMRRWWEDDIYVDGKMRGWYTKMRRWENNICVDMKMRR